MTPEEDTRDDLPPAPPANAIYEFTRHEKIFWSSLFIGFLCFMAMVFYLAFR